MRRSKRCRSAVSHDDDKPKTPPIIWHRRLSDCPFCLAGQTRVPAVFTKSLCAMDVITLPAPACLLWMALVIYRGEPRAISHQCGVGFIMCVCVRVCVFIEGRGWWLHGRQHSKCTVTYTSLIVVIAIWTHKSEILAHSITGIDVTFLRIWVLWQQTFWVTKAYLFNFKFVVISLILKLFIVMTPHCVIE